MQTAFLRFELWSLSTFPMTVNITSRTPLTHTHTHTHTHTQIYIYISSQYPVILLTGIGFSVKFRSKSKCLAAQSSGLQLSEDWITTSEQVQRYAVKKGSYSKKRMTTLLLLNCWVRVSSVSVSQCQVMSYSCEKEKNSCYVNCQNKFSTFAIESHFVSSLLRSRLFSLNFSDYERFLCINSFGLTLFTLPVS